MAKGANQKLRIRTTWLLIIILLIGFGAAVFRIAYLQLIKGEELKNSAVQQQLSDISLNANRGTIYDRNGIVLAKSASVWKVIMAPANFKNDEQRAYASQRLSEILDMDQEELFEKTKLDSQYAEIKRKIENDEREQIIELQNELSDKYELESVIYLADDYKRYYPYGELASSVIGFTGSEDQGLEGIEYQYNDYLTGIKGRLVTAQNSAGSVLPFAYSQNIEATDGSSIVLTLDETIQSIVEKHMKQGVIENDVYNRGVCIVMDVNTGEVLAMASVDGYDLNDPYKLTDKAKKEISQIDKNYLIEHGEELSEELGGDFTTEGKTKDEIDELVSTARYTKESVELAKMWRNKAVSDTYYPGSVFKIITSSMMLEEGLVSSGLSFYCSGSAKVYDQDIGCHLETGHGAQTFEQAIMNSCNPAFIRMGEMIGADKFYQYYTAFGYSRKTGIDLPGESDGIFFANDEMGPADLAVASFGQGISVTPIQMITAVSAVANGGNLVQPHLVKQIENADGNVIKTFGTTIKRQVVSPEVSERMNQILEENAISGGATNGYVAGYRVTGKTGTSEKLVDVNGDGIKDHIASYCGYAPADDPQIATLVFFDAPLGYSYYGSAVAAPVFARIMEEILPYLEVEPEYTEEELQNVDISTGTYVGLSVSEAQSAVEQSGLSVTVKGSGDMVIAQIPKSGSAIPSGGTVVLYTDESSVEEKVTVPNLIGYSVSDANYLASYYGINISISGATSTSGSLSVSQDIAAGESVSPGTVVRVTFETSGIND